MQQTEKRGFNIIETSDTFSPETLNDNTRKIEAALDAHEAAVKSALDALETYADAGDAVLEKRIVNLEKLRFAYGSYVGNSLANRTFNIGFTPVALFIWSSNNRRLMLFVEGCTYDGVYTRITTNGFYLPATDAPSNNMLNYQYCYVAFGLE